MSDCQTCGYPAPCGRCEGFFGYQWPHDGDVLAYYPSDDEIREADEAHAAAHDRAGVHIDLCIGPDCPLGHTLETRP